MLDIKKLALLARIKLDENEEKNLQKEFGAILGYISKLKELDISGISDEEGNKTTELADIARSDSEKINESGAYSEKLLAAAPETERGYIKVKHIFE